MDDLDRTESGAAASVERTTPRMAGRYEILQEIGRGGMGIVYKARQPDLDRLVALKQLHSVHASASELVQRFVREAELAGSLNHRNIVTVHDYVEEHGTAYIAMEYMPRGSLRPWVGDLSLAQLAGVLEGLLAGLAAVEPKSIVHRDLKPENVMVAGDGLVKITDFGIAKATQSTSVASFMTITGTTVGTPAYMAPEQALSQEVGPWTDLYSVGVMAYEQLVGNVPFHNSETPVAILLRHVNEPIPPVIDSRPDLHPSFSEWVARLLVKDPARRTPSAAQAWEELEEILIELLGARWRRDARLPERGSSASTPTPLAPAPFDSRQIQTPDASSALLPSALSQDPSSEPQAESGFLSYGRVPTGAEPSPRASSEHRSDNPSISARRESPDRRPVQAPHRRAPQARTGRVRRPRVRRLGPMALLAVLTGVAGFVLAPAGESTRTPARGNSVSVEAPRHVPNRAYAVALSGAMSTLNGVRARAGAQLTHANTAHAQATAAQQLANAHQQAAATVRKAAPGSAERTVNTAIVTALTDMGRGYSTMANSARHENRRNFDSGRKLVTTATASLAAALARLHALGYKVNG